MSITVINHKGCRSYGFYVRAYVKKGHPELTKFIAFNKHGGFDKAKELAKEVELQLKHQAARLR